MRICFLGDIRSIHTKRWIEFFAKTHEVHLISLDYPAGEMSNVSYEDYIRMNVIVHLIPKKFPWILGNVLKIKKILDDIKPDLLHAHFVTHYGYWGACSGFHPLVVSAWGDDVLIHPKKFPRSYFVKYALRMADLITCDGDNSQDAILSLGLPLGKIQIIMHGVDTKKFSPLLRNQEIFKKIFGNTNPVVICIRGFNPIYDPETFIRSIPLVISEYPDVNFIIAGQGYDEVRIRQLTESLGISASVYFCGWLSHDELPRYLASSDIYVSVSLSDGGMAVSTFEAMASGLVPIVTDVGDNRKWITDGHNGYVIPVKRSDILAEMIIQVLKHPEDRESFGQINRSIVKEKQDYYKEMTKVHTLYENLVKR